MSKSMCIDIYYNHLKFSDDTEIVHINLLMSSEEDFVDISEGVKNKLKVQLAEQINCTVELLTKVDLVQSEEEGYIELGFVIMSLNDNRELKKAVINVHRATDKGQLRVITPSSVCDAVPETVLFRQYISGYPKPTQERLNSPDLGNIITGISFIVLIIFTVLIAMTSRTKRLSHPRATIKESTDKREERQFQTRQHVSTFMLR
ncbi:uncharacterized protein LOC132726187 [Ruditapes philippinarum]|uniref:uncharacterized protein LOC132726187 n=1 Tax=Ruditapes philippinarum TaxID=129788 RepID=UPI00295B2DC7|nr:uncharacterized protein LOC132726187 [Ruditapes philippinarum]